MLTNFCTMTAVSSADPFSTTINSQGSSTVIPCTDCRQRASLPAWVDLLVEIADDDDADARSFEVRGQFAQQLRTFVRADRSQHRDDATEGRGVRPLHLPLALVKDASRSRQLLRGGAADECEHDQAGNRNSPEHVPHS